MAAPTGPPIGNQPLPDSYLRIKQQLDSLQNNHSELVSRMDAMDKKVSRLDKQLAQYQKLQTIKTLTP